MSPEQARGRAADKRSDIWAFGCVFYEMLAGRRAFEGEEVSDTLASVLKSDPDWTALPATLPAPIRALVEGSLKRDRRDRIADISTARFLLNQPLTPSPATNDTRLSRQPVWKWAALLATGAVIGAGAVAGVRAWRPASAPPPITRFSFTLPQGQQLNLPRLAIAISPDGTRIAYSANDRLFVRTMADPEPRPIPGSELAIGPAFSPDSQSLVYWSDSWLKRIPVAGGVPLALCKVGPGPSSLSWDDNGILFPQPGTGIMRVSPNGGKPEVVIALSTGDGLAHGPQMLPDGDTMLFTLAQVGETANLDRWATARIVMQSLKTGRRQTLIESGIDARYVPSGHIVYAVGGTLFARPNRPEEARTYRRTGACRRRRAPRVGGARQRKCPLRVLQYGIARVPPRSQCGGNPEPVSVRSKRSGGGIETPAGSVRFPSRFPGRQTRGIRIDRREGSVRRDLPSLGNEFVHPDHVWRQ
jgi:serine/threonine-protein kinase